MKPSKVQAFAYLRVSGRDQVDGDGFPRQAAAIQRYASTHGIHIAQTFKERGVSGTKDLDNRPALVELLAAVADGGANLILIEKLDRLARDLMVQENIIADLRKRGVELVSVMEPDLCQDDPTRKLMRQIFGGIAEYEKTMIVLKLRGARQRTKAATGRCEGRRPYGDRHGELDAINRMRALREAGSTYDQIAAALTAEGIPTRIPGRRWFGSTVSKVLKHRKIAVLLEKPAN